MRAHPACKERYGEFPVESALGAPVRQWILASDGQPFRSRATAQIKCDLLASELGTEVALKVTEHPSGGFAVQVGSIVPTPEPGPIATSPRDALLSELDRKPSARSSPPDGLPAMTTHHAGGAGPTAASRTPAPSYPEAFRLSPAVRAFIGLHLQAVLGALLLLQPHRVFTVTGLSIPTGTGGAVMLGLTALCGALLALTAVSRFLWAYTANTYLVDARGVEQVQWYFDKGKLRRRAPRVNFAHLRSADVDQTVLQMLLNVGSVKLAAGAIDSYEVVLQHVSSPRALKREFQRRLQHVNATTRAEPRISDL
ncbi:hypothetical protein [Steroidobacter sp.]|uniref:hypothetical protein n=1 Tax=Steroidobacter sp. TaxID=1978227 RepID=UPI001A4AFB91|nr:hypothetical protein [Steroidobacter sp.]MBL8271965.1 PH domain-containing protein [Steroidobacter sp.]